MQGEMSQGRNVAQGEMSLWEKCRREKSRREKCRREKCLSGRNVVQSLPSHASTTFVFMVIHVCIFLHLTMFLVYVSLTS